MLSFKTTWINLEGIMLLEIGQTQKEKQNKTNCIILLIQGI